MAALSSKLRSLEGGHAHWCPACREMHVVPSRWTFDGNVQAPTFAPSVRITGKQTVRAPDGSWTGYWVRNAEGDAADRCCHYFLIGGRISFCGDCTHALRGQTVELPDLPPDLR